MDERFRGRPGPRWHTLQQGGGRLAVLEHGLRLATAGASRGAYSNAQIDDYGAAPRARLPWRPPLTLTVRARLPTALRGTAGFGFWNSPISPLGSWPSPPAALWFLYASPPSDMRPALDAQGGGWRAACMDLTTPAALRWAPLAPAAIALARWRALPALRGAVWRRIQRDLRVAEAPLGEPDPAWRTYTIEWRRDGARLAIDGRTALESPAAPRGPLGFVAWVDTQWLVATPEGRFGWGLLDAPAPQYIEIESIQIAPG